MSIDNAGFCCVWWDCVTTLSLHPFISTGQKNFFSSGTSGLSKKKYRIYNPTKFPIFFARRQRSNQLQRVLLVSQSIYPNKPGRYQPFDEPLPDNWGKRVLLSYIRSSEVQDWTDRHWFIFDHVHQTDVLLPSDHGVISGPFRWQKKNKICPNKFSCHFALCCFVFFFWFLSLLDYPKPTWKQRLFFVSVLFRLLDQVHLVVLLFSVNPKFSC